MPELPEIETLKRYLEKPIIGKTISTIQQNRSNLRYTLATDLAEKVASTKIQNLIRRAKYLILELNNGYSLVVHLGMSGRFTLQQNHYQLQKHDHVIFYLNSGEQLVFNDHRRFGMIFLFKTSELKKASIFINLGPEPLSDDYNPEYLQAKLVRKKAPIKNVIMDNNIVVGIGNIYASESLFLAGIHPEKPAYMLSYQEIEKLVSANKIVLQKAINAGGTTLKDFVSGDSTPGYFQQELLVYGRAGKACYNCGAIIVKIKQAGRASFYCPTCNRM